MKNYLYTLIILLILLLSFGCLQRGCSYNEPSCGQNYSCINNSCFLKTGCDLSNPSCESGYYCLNNQCVLKNGCDYGNPVCDSANYSCINNICVLNQGCQYNNPPCNLNYLCINNTCVRKSGCDYGNPVCTEKETCISNTCVLKNDCNPSCPSDSACVNNTCVIKGQKISSIPNVAILEFAENDPARTSTGNVNMEAVVQKFYQKYPDDFDMLVTFDIGIYNGKYSGWSDGSIHRYVPTNIGFVEYCRTLENPTCNGYPQRLRYMQEISLGDQVNQATRNYSFVHEIGHYWSIGWTTWKQPGCYEPWASYVADPDEGHWSGNFEAGEHSIMAYNAKDKNGAAIETYGRWVDNRDGTFTTEDTGVKAPRFNYMDLYAMGLISEKELSTKNMFTVYNLVSKFKDPIAAGYNSDDPEWYTYYGTRRNVTLDDFKKMLIDKEACEGIDYYTGDGSRVLNPYDKGKEFAKDFRIALVLIKFPEQEISNKKARQICQSVNYDFPKSWHQATYNMSTMHTYLSSETQSPDCDELFPQELD